MLAVGVACMHHGIRAPPQNRQAHRLTPALEMYTSALASSVKALHLSPDASAALALALIDSRAVRDDAVEAAAKLSVTLPPVGEVRLKNAAVKFHNRVRSSLPPRWSDTYTASSAPPGNRSLLTDAWLSAWLCPLPPSHCVEWGSVVSAANRRVFLLTWAIWTEGPYHF